LWIFYIACVVIPGGNRMISGGETSMAMAEHTWKDRYWRTWTWWLWAHQVASFFYSEWELEQGKDGSQTDLAGGVCV